jgi:hypothetical protein
MADADKPDEADLLALIAQIHGSSPEEQRQSHVEAALTALEATHRAAARALRDLHVAGMRREPGALPAQAAAQPATMTDTTAADGAPPVTGAPLQGGPAPGPAAAQSPPKAGQPQNVTVQSGEGAEVDLGQRTLTQIVRPNRGRR